LVFIELLCLFENGGGALEEKDQYVIDAFKTICDYLVFATKFLLFVTIVTLC
jgi:hypothetical protein